MTTQENLNTLEPDRTKPGLSYDDQRAYQDMNERPRGWPVLGVSKVAYPQTRYGREVYRRIRAEQKVEDLSLIIRIAHERLDELGVPRGNPPLDNAPLSGRIAYLGRRR
jgi:hypothetical protein